MSTMYVLLVLCGLMINYSHQAVHSEFSGPFDLDVQTFKLCEDEKQQGTKMITVTNIKTIRLNRTTKAHSMTITLKTSFADEKDIRFKVAQWRNGGWIENLIDKKVPKPFSFAEKSAPDFLKPFYKAAGIEKPPFLPGSYLLDNYIMRPEELNVPNLPYNKYKLLVIFMEKDTNLGCVELHVDVTPQKKSKG